MPTERHEGRDVLTGRAVRVVSCSGVIEDVELLDTNGDLPWLSPALVDLQVNGFGGVDINSVNLTVGDVSRMARTLANHGTGAWVPTIITQSRERISHALDILATAVASDPFVAAAVRFAHIEGPFISPLDGPRGAHAREFVRDISVDEVLHWHQIFPIGYVTVSPHWDNAPRKIAQLRRAGVHVAIGHTHATANQVAAASAAGATLSTHLGNGMTAEIARHPNLLWEQIADPTLEAGLIADGHHLPAAVLETVIRAKGVERCFLVSDSVALAGSAPGRYTAPVGGDVVLSADRRLALANDERLLAGSAVSLADCVHFAVKNTRLSPSDVFAMATRVPGRIFGSLGAGNSVGILSPGSRANLILWDDGFEPVEYITVDRS